jgi:hypothetical protein
MNSGYYYLALFLMFGVVHPLFWLLTLAVLRWIGERVLSDHVGRLLFGRYWRKGHGAGYRPL